MNLWWSEHRLLDQSNIYYERWTCKSPDLWECLHTNHFWKFNLFGNQGPSCFHKLLLDHKKNGCCYHTLHNLGAHALVKACQTLKTYHLDNCIQCTWRETNIASKQASLRTNQMRLFAQTILSYGALKVFSYETPSCDSGVCCLEFFLKCTWYNCQARWSC